MVMDSINGPIERGIDPPRQRGPLPVYVIEDLKVGDSRLFNAAPNLVRSAIWPRAKALGWKLQTAAEGRGCRVWRME